MHVCFSVCSSSAPQIHASSIASPQASQVAGGSADADGSGGINAGGVANRLGAQPSL